MTVFASDWVVPDDSGVAIGVFDGVHRGHAAVIEQLVGECGRRGIESGVLTFEPHPIEVLAPGRAPALLTTIGRRTELLMALGVSWVGVLDLNDIRTMSPEDFIEKLLVDRASTRLVLVGDDFRFGHERAGDVDLLRSQGERHGFDVTALDLVSDEYSVISSTRIRGHIEEGRVAEAAVLLGRPHRVSGEVIRGEARGRDLGFPTANIHPPGRMAIPADGIYAVRVEGAATGGGVASLGVRPTFADAGERLLEVHLFDFDSDLYGQTLDVDFIERLRPEERFDTVDDLVAQMDRDAAAARRVLSNHG